MRSRIELMSFNTHDYQMCYKHSFLHSGEEVSAVGVADCRDLIGPKGVPPARVKATPVMYRDRVNDRHCYR